MENGKIKLEEKMGFANDLLEYLLVVHPDPAVYDQVNEEKKNFYNDYGKKIAIKTKPHITIANFLAKSEMEGTMIRWLERICGQKNAFNVTLNNYSGFPSHTIFIRVQDHTPFQQLAKDLKVIDGFVRSNGCPAARLITRPHLTIARHLPEATYQQAMMDYSQKTFHASFDVKELVLLKRRNQFDGCAVVNVFHLQPAIANGQGYQNNLFN